MKFFLVALLALFVSFASAYDARQRYTFYSMNNSKVIYDYRVDDFSRLLGDSLFGQNGLFVFYEHFGIQRLYIRFYGYADEDLHVYQLPKTETLLWLHPEKFMEERERLLKGNVPLEECGTKISAGEKLLVDLDSLHMDRHLFVHPTVSYGRDMKHIIMGFSQIDGIRHYFYYVKYENFWEQKDSRFAVYADVFKIMESLDSMVALPGCR